MFQNRRTLKCPASRLRTTQQLETFAFNFLNALITNVLLLDIRRSEELSFLKPQDGQKKKKKKDKDKGQAEDDVIDLDNISGSGNGPRFKQPFIFWLGMQCTSQVIECLLCFFCTQGYWFQRCLKTNVRLNLTIFTSALGDHYWNHFCCTQSHNFSEYMHASPLQNHTPYQMLDIFPVMLCRTYIAVIFSFCLFRVFFCSLVFCKWNALLARSAVHLLCITYIKLTTNSNHYALC